MENINEILSRKDIEIQIKHILTNFDELNKDTKFKKGIYVYGSPGCGKTQFVKNILKDLDFDNIHYDAGDVRNKSLMDSITSNNISCCNVLDMMNGKKKQIVLVMDEIDGLNNGDKGGINALIKIIRQKKTKKQRAENKSANPIICIGNYYMDKKIKELMKVCNVFELEKPTDNEIGVFLNSMILNNQFTNDYKMHIIKYIQGDLRKLVYFTGIYIKKPHLINDKNIKNIFQLKSHNDDAKQITKTLINKKIDIEKHISFMNETDRTIVALLWHENIIDMIENTDIKKSIPFYLKILDNICYADYIDRVTFQNQIWQFNEMSSLIKTFHNNKIYHDTFPEYDNKYIPINNEVRFTKVLTKYSTEFNNIVFIYNLCQQLDMDKKDMISFFQELRLFYGKEFYDDTNIYTDIESLFEGYTINKLDIKRIYRYIDKNVKKDTIIEDEDN
jgi:DNA polymerase III delta prime subunit